jgi:hypothetical protein
MVVALHGLSVGGLLVTLVAVVAVVVVVAVMMMSLRV